VAQLNNLVVTGNSRFLNTMVAQGGVYADSYTGALDMNNSNIFGVNSIYTADASDHAGEGIHFYRDATHVDTLWMSGGDLLFVPNRALGTSTTKANSQKVARFTTNPTTGQVVVTDGTTGGVISSGFTIGTTVPQNAVFTDTKVTAVGNHYTPSGGSAKTPTGDTDTDITNLSSGSGSQVISGVTIDAAGHVTGLTSKKIRSVNTTYSAGTGIAISNANAISVSYGTSATTACVGNDSRLSDSRTPKSHTHGNIQNNGTLQTTDVDVASGDKLVVTDANSTTANQIVRSSIAFDGSTTTKCLTQKGTWASFTNNAGTVTSVKVGTTSYSPSSGVVSLPAYPTTLPASDTTSTYSSTGTAPVNGTAVASAIGTTTIATSTSTNQITLAANTKYAITAAGTSYVFTMPPIGCVYCPTAAGTAAKVATCTGYYLTLAKSWLQVILVNTNSSKSALTLAINGQTAKPIFINGTASSSSNYTLSAGSYLVYYDGTNYYFRNDGKIPAEVTSMCGYFNTVTNSSANRQASANITSTNNGGIRTFIATSSMTTCKPAVDGNIIHFDWDSGTKYCSQLAILHGDGRLQHRYQTGAGNTADDWTQWYSVYSEAYKPSPADIGAATSDHTHETKIATSTGTNKITLAAATKYAITAGGTSYVFTTPTDSDTKNTTGADNTTSKIFLVGPTAQTSSNGSARTYSNANVYATNGTLTSTKTDTKAIIARTGSGTAGSTSDTTPKYTPTKWTFNSGITVADGEVYFIKIPKAGGTYGVWCSLNNGTNYYPVAISSGKGRFTTHYGVNTVIAITYESAGVCTCYPLAGGDTTSDVTGIFRVLNDYDANTNTAVTQTATTTSANYEVLFSATADNTTRTEGARKTSTLTYNPSSQLLSTSTVRASAALEVNNTTTNGSQVRFRFSDLSSSQYALMYAARDTNYGGRLRFRQYSENSSGTLLSKYETYQFPKTTQGLSANKDYTIITTKNLISGNSVTVSDSSGNVTLSIPDTVAPAYTITPTRPMAWTMSDAGILATRWGNVIQVVIRLEGSGASVAAGTDGFSGKISVSGGGYLPARQVTLIGYTGQTLLMGWLDTDGSLTVRANEATQVASGNGLWLTGMFITNTNTTG